MSAENLGMLFKTGIPGKTSRFFPEKPKNQLFELTDVHFRNKIV